MGGVGGGGEDEIGGVNDGREGLYPSPQLALLLYNEPLAPFLQTRPIDISSLAVAPLLPNPINEFDGVR